MYRIKISYRTGDSFGSEDRQSYLDGEWSNLEVLAENLQRIKDHYLWYEQENNSYRFAPKGTLVKPEYVSDKYDMSLKLKLDNGTEYQVSAFWCGYFERLYGASIALDMGFEI